MGPPLGKKYIVFVDDLEVSERAAGAHASQKSLELLP